MKKFLIMSLMATSLTLTVYATDDVPQECVDIYKDTILFVQEKGEKLPQKPNEIMAEMKEKWQSLDKNGQEQMLAQCKISREMLNFLKEIEEINRKYDKQSKESN